VTLGDRRAIIKENVPKFPMKQWLQFLAKVGKARVLQLRNEQLEVFGRNCVATSGEDGSDRMVANYAAVATAWHLVCEFCDLPLGTGNFIADLTQEMNSHITESAGERQPWAKIVDKLLSEIASHQFRYPFKFDIEDEVPVLCVRTGHVMAHLSGSNTLRQFWDSLSIKSDRAFKKQLATAGVLLMKPDSPEDIQEVERTVRGARVGHMVALSLEQLSQFGLHAVIPEEKDEREGGDGFSPTSTSRKIPA